jgi:hypothetical protein
MGPPGQRGKGDGGVPLQVLPSWALGRKQGWAILVPSALFLISDFLSIFCFDFSSFISDSFCKFLLNQFKTISQIIQIIKAVL